MDDVTVNGIRLDPPRSLDDDECSELAGYNTASGKGVVFNEATVSRMAQLQLRFDWLGYFSADGEGHSGPRAAPPVITVHPERMWRLSRR